MMMDFPGSDKHKCQEKTPSSHSCHKASPSCRKMAFDISQHSSSWFVVLLLLVLCCSSGCYGAGALCSFSNGQYVMVLRVREDLKVGATIDKLNITGDNSQITVALDAPSDIVTLDPATRELKVKKVMDADKSFSAKQVKLKCTTTTNQKVILTVMISLIDVNEHAPVFEKSVYTLEIGELTPVGTTLLTTISATDADVMNQNILYSIQPGGQSKWALGQILEYFNMPMPGKGILQLVKALDYEVFNNMSCIITATDHHQNVNTTSGAGHLTGTATLQITVKDGDNRNPVFVGAPYTGRIQASSLRNALIIMDKPIKAVDGDSGINEQIYYAIPQVAGIKNHFSIDPNSGALKLDIPGPPAGANLVTVQAYQKDKPKLRVVTTGVVVNVQAANAVPPAFSQHTYIAKVLENEPVGASLVQLLATDKDQVNLGPNGSILTYTLPDTDTFTVDKKSGVISLAKALDYENLEKYQLQTFVSDGTFTSSATVAINVLNVNDNDPKFNSDSYIFKYKIDDEDKVFGRVTVTDEDKGDKVTLTLRDYKHIFSLNQAGELRMVGKKGDLSMSKYQLIIDAVDDGKPPRRAVGVAIVDFPPGMVTGPVTGASKETEIDLIPLIILACLCGLLLLIIIGLIIYIHKRGGCCQEKPRTRSKEIPTTWMAKNQGSQSISKNSLQSEVDLDFTWLDYSPTSETKSFSYAESGIGSLTSSQIAFVLPSTKC